MIKRAIGRAILGGVLLSCSVSTLIAATPPAQVNYQGVLRNASDSPLDGTYDMTFRFFSADVGGDEILVDTHAAPSGSAVSVSTGLFNVELGGGVLSDGSGPGTYATLAHVFRDYGQVYLEVEIGGEVLSPRTRIVAAAYALNADHLDGKQASEFLDTSASMQTRAGKLVVSAPTSPDHGIEGYGPTAGGYFKNTTLSGYARLGYFDTGVVGQGNASGGYFEDLNNLGRAWVGYSNYGIQATGGGAGGYFLADGLSGWAYVGVGNTGIEAHGNGAGGYFRDDNSTGSAYAGYGDRGIHATGSEAGGYFKDSDHSGYAYVGYGDRGIWGYGNFAGGQFNDANESGNARVGSGHLGIAAYGNTAGGFFDDADSSGYAYVGYGDYGIQGFGNRAGGYFQNIDGSGWAILGDDLYGLDSRGGWGGGYFGSTLNSGYAYVASGDFGIEAYGNTVGGKFVDLDSAGWGQVGYGSWKIWGSGAVSFVQNHPEDSGRLIVYAAPEGDEVATYTRGMARLAGGEARVPLGETFKWVTNPDVGLTAHVTPRDAAVPLAVVSLTTRELVVRGPADGPPDVAFDYVVYGLRIGFEEVTVVQEKTTEAMIPSMQDHRDAYRRRPELRRYNALERFKGMTAEVQGADAEAFDFRGAVALRAAIQEYDPAVHGPLRHERGRREVPGSVAAQTDPTVTTSSVSPESSAVEPTTQLDVAQGSFDSAGEERAKPAPDPASVFPVDEVARPGDLVALDPLRPGRLRRADTAADPEVAGIVAAEPFERNGVLLAPLVNSRYGFVRVDASYGAIRAGDLLTSSPTPGHAMAAIAPEPGTVVGKALEPLDSGTGTIRVLVMPR